MLTRRQVLAALAALPACGPPRMPREAPGVHELSDQIRGKKRRSLLFVPEGLTDVAPMLVALHDAGETPETGLARWQAVCAAEGWVGLFPDYPKGDFKEDNENLAHVIQRASAMGGVDRRRIFLFGHGTGGRRAYAFAASQSGLLTAVATSGAVLAFAGPGADTPVAPGVSLLHLHGADDAVVPWSGGPLAEDAKSRVVVPVVDALGPWRQVVEAGDAPVVDTVDGAQRTTWTGPHREVVLQVTPGGHDRHDAQLQAARSFFSKAPPQG